MDEPKNPRNDSHRPPLQFSLRTLLAITVLVSLLFGTLRWFDVPPFASTVVLIVLVGSSIAALALVIAISWAADDDH